MVSALLYSVFKTVPNILLKIQTWEFSNKCINLKPICTYKPYDIITPGEHVRNLGVIMDTKFTMEPHITKIMQIAFLKIRQISYYRKRHHLLWKHSSMHT